MPIPVFDANLGKKVELIIKTTGPYGGAVEAQTIAFQFPPVITSDNKGGNWKEWNSYAEEPIVVFMGAKPREISMEWTYIVSDETGGVNPQKWSIYDISWLVKAVRGYFYKVAGSENAIIQYRAYNVVGGGSETWSFRMDDLSVTHSKTLIQNKAGWVYPLRTDLKATLKFFVNGTSANANEIYKDSGGGVVGQGFDWTNIYDDICNPPPEKTGEEFGEFSSDDKEAPVKLSYIKPIPRRAQWY